MAQRDVLIMTDRQSERYTVVVPSLPGCTSEGKTVAEALDNVRIAIAAHFAKLANGVQSAEGSPNDALRIAIV